MNLKYSFTIYLNISFNRKEGKSFPASQWSEDMKVLHPFLKAQHKTPDVVHVEIIKVL